MEVVVVVLDVADVSGLVLRDTFSTVVPDSALSELVDADLDLGLTPSAETKVSTETLLSNMIYLSTLKQFEYHVMQISSGRDITILSS